MRKSENPESGNVFAIILVAVVLFAALGFSISSGFRSDTTTTLSKRQADIAAAEILTQAQKMVRAVNRARSRGCSESEISFENNTVAGYNFATRDQCRIFGDVGAKLVYKAPEEGWLVSDYSAQQGYGQWWFAGTNRVGSIGTAATPSGNELIAVAGYLDESLCTEINDRLGVTNPPPSDGGATGILFDSAKYAGAFSGSSTISGTGINGNTAACFASGGGAGPATGTYHFYQVLIER